MTLLVALACTKTPTDTSEPADTAPEEERVDTDDGPVDDDAGLHADATLDLGEVEVGELVERTLILENDDEHELSLALAEGTVFSAQVLSETRVVVSFTPETWGEVGDTLTVSGGDQTVEVALTGTGLAAELSVSPLELALGPVSVGCTVEQELLFENTGNATGTFGSSSYSSSQTFVDGGEITQGTGDSGWSNTLDAGDTMAIVLSYSPLDEADDAWTFSIETDDPANPLFEGAWTLSGQIEQENEERFSEGAVATYELADPPVEPTLSVTVAGSEASWSLAGQTLTLDETPRPGQEVVISYVVDACP